MKKVMRLVLVIFWILILWLLIYQVFEANATIKSLISAIFILGIFSLLNNWQSAFIDLLGGSSHEESSIYVNGLVRKGHELIPFTDILAKEIIRIKRKLDHIMIDRSEWQKEGFTEDFLLIEAECRQYPYATICDTYRTLNGKWGKILLHIDSRLIDNWGIDTNDLTAEDLRILMSPKETEVYKGRMLPIHILEPGLGRLADGKYCYATVESIRKYSKYKPDSNVIIKLKIDLNDDASAYADGIFDKREPYVITREVEIYDTWRHGIVCKDLEEALTEDY